MGIGAGMTRRLPIPKGPLVATFMGFPLKDMTRDELISVITLCAEMEQRARDRILQSGLATIRAQPAPA